MLRLNIGCGETKIEGCVNVDCEKMCDPDLLIDIRKERLPYEDGEVDEVWMIHALEHIEFKHWDTIFREFSRVLKPNGTLLLSYPEFGKCAEYYLSNHGNQRNFFRMALYGRQLWPSDYHVAPMHSPEVKEILEIYKFYRISYRPEGPGQDCNTTLIAFKDPEQYTREDIIVRELNLQK